MKTPAGTRRGSRKRAKIDPWGVTVWFVGKLRKLEECLYITYFYLINIIFSIYKVHMMLNLLIILVAMVIDSA